MRISSTQRGMCHVVVALLVVAMATGCSGQQDAAPDLIDARAMLETGHPRQDNIVTLSVSRISRGVTAGDG